MKNLLLTMSNPTMLSQAIAQDIYYDNYLFECCQDKHWEPSLVQKKFMAPIPPQPVLSIAKG
jgi:hypothetical protein